MISVRVGQRETDQSCALVVSELLLCCLLVSWMWPPRHEALSPDLFIKKEYLINLFERATEKKDLSLHSPSGSDVTQAETWNQELQAGLQHEWLRPKCLAHLLLLSRKLDWK